MANLNNGMNKDYLKKNIIGIIAILVITLAVIIIYKIATTEREPNYPEWTDAEYGDIVISNEIEEIEEIPENIVDAYGLEYEFVKLPSYGISTYKPVNWEILFDNDFIYFLSPDDVEGNYKHTEIGICVMNIGSINNSYDRSFAQNYIERNVKNHNTMELESMLVTNNKYAAIKDGDELFAYYCAPNIEFTRIDQPEKGGWNPYSVFYMLNTDTDLTTFCCISGPRNYQMELDEIAKTIAYNTTKYKNTKFDFNELIDVHMKKTNLKDIFYIVKDSNDVIVNNSVNGDILSDTTRTNNIYKLSNTPTSLAYNCYLIVQQDYLDCDIEDFVDESFMKTMWYQTSAVYSENTAEFARKQLSSPSYVIDNIEKINIANKDARKVTWHIDVSLDSSARIYVDSIMPKMFTTYLIPDETSIYSFTINYTKYQKYAANEYIDKTIQTFGFNKD